MTEHDPTRFELLGGPLHGSFVTDTRPITILSDGTRRDAVKSMSVTDGKVTTVVDYVFRTLHFIEAEEFADVRGAFFLASLTRDQMEDLAHERFGLPRFDEEQKQHPVVLALGLRGRVHVHGWGES